MLYHEIKFILTPFSERLFAGYLTKLILTNLDLQSRHFSAAVTQ